MPASGWGVQGDRICGSRRLIVILRFRPGHFPAIFSPSTRSFADLIFSLILLNRSFGMDAQATVEIPRAFLTMTDPRQNNSRHRFVEVLTIALFAVICGSDDWPTVVMYGQAKLDWLKTFLELPYGIPSHDTFGRIFARIDPDAFETCFRKWMASLVDLSGGKLVAIDGKSLRRSFAHGWDKSGMAHMVSVFVQANSLVFAQEKTDGKGQELSAIGKLLEVLDLKGAVVSIDAIGTQKNVASKIIDAGADYILQVKDNQPTLATKIKVAMDDAILDKFKDLTSDQFEQIDAGHGRIEKRKLWVCWDVKEMLGELAADWPGLSALIAIERTRELMGPKGVPKKSIERHYYISSLDRRTKAQRLAGYVRGHWSVENNLHWQLDVSFCEDQRRMRNGHSAENFSRMCRAALNLLKNEKTVKGGIASRRKKCGWDNDYLLKVIAA
jgi:predicted transposase YbfD/YdcC